MAALAPFFIGPAFAADATPSYSPRLRGHEAGKLYWGDTHVRKAWTTAEIEHGAR